MVLEFSQSEIVALLKQLGYVITEDDPKVFSSKFKNWKNVRSYKVQIDGQLKSPEDVFKSLIINNLLLNKNGN